MDEETALEELREQVRISVGAGDDDVDDIISDAVACYEGEEDPDNISAMATRIVEEEVQRHQREQEHWPAVTDSDRLASAFMKLDEAGIVARESFTCCQSCGVNEILGEADDHPSPRGYVFYHQQDAEGAFRGEGLYLSYGATEQDTSEATIVALGREVTAVLHQHELPVSWDDDIGTRIYVPLTWQRRRAHA